MTFVEANLGGKPLCLHWGQYFLTEDLFIVDFPYIPYLLGLLLQLGHQHLLLQYWGNFE